LQRKNTKGGNLFQRAVHQISSSPVPNQQASIGLNDKGLLPVTEEDGQLSIYSAMLIMKIHAEAVKRSVGLSLPTDLAKNASILFHVLLDSIGRQYVETALETTIEQLAAMDGKTDPDFKPLTSLKVAKDIMHLAQNHFQIVILPLASASLTIHRDLIAEKNKFMLGLENKMNMAVQKMVDGINSLHFKFDLVTETLSKKTDFRPKDGDDSILSLATGVHSGIGPHIDGKNLEHFLTEVGMAFHSMLLEHFRKFTVSPAGALVLTKDIAKYQEAIAQYKIAALDECFEMLREIGNLFVVKLDIIPSVLSEGFLSKIEVQHLQPYLAARTDFKSGGIEKLIVANTGVGGNSFNEKARDKLAAIGIGMGLGREVEGIAE
ncbi:3210_t:CDS:2, partial [Paraglomus occultum]